MAGSPTDHPYYLEYRRLRFAESYWLEARAALDMLHEVDQDTDYLGLRRRALFAALGVCYARPFSGNRLGVDPFDWDCWVPEDKSLTALHYKLLKMRKTAWAHTDGNRRYRDVLVVKDGDRNVWGIKWTPR